MLLGLPPGGYDRGHGDAGAEGDPGLRERPVASLLPADQQATSSPLASLQWEARRRYREGSHQACVLE
jgi:hypothetical protein